MEYRHRTRRWGHNFKPSCVPITPDQPIDSPLVGECRSAVCDAEDVYVENGNLVMRSRRSSTYPYTYTTGAVTTTGKVTWTDQPGFRMCVSAILPGGPDGGQGTWPAHWMMPDDSSCDPDEGEMDIMEMIRCMNHRECDV